MWKNLSDKLARSGGVQSDAYFYGTQGPASPADIVQWNVVPCKLVGAVDRPPTISFV
jgi:hypothetical protein